MAKRVLWRVVAATAIAVLAVAYLGLRQGQGAGAKAPRLASFVDRGVALGGRKAPAFQLVDQFGRPVRLAAWRGKVVMLAFVDDQCTTICPLTTQSMAMAKRLLGPAAGEVALVAVNANPLHTSVEDVRAYVAAHGLTGDLSFLTGSRAELEKVWRAYGIGVQILAGQIDHTPALYVLDRSGRERRLYLTASQYAGVGQEAYVLAREAASLLPGRIRIAPPTGKVAAIGPARGLRLPLAAGGTLAVGPGHPRLYLFLDAWAPRIRQEIGQQAAYQAAAGRAGLPPLALVDVRDAEASPQALPSLLGSLPAASGLPLAVDAQGRLADGYGARDIPWYALVGEGGKVVWSHDGWLSAGALLQAVAKAGS